LVTFEAYSSAELINVRGSKEDEIEQFLGLEEFLMNSLLLPPYSINRLKKSSFLILSFDIRLFNQSVKCFLR